MLQLFTPSRICSTVDLLNNILGSALGVAAGIIFLKIVDVPAIEIRVRDRRSVALLFCWLAFLIFPLFPVLGFATFRAKFSAFAHGRIFSPIPMFLSAAEWYAAGRLLLASGAKSPLLWLCALLLLVPAQFAIVNHNPMPSDFLGAAAGALLFLVFGRSLGDAVPGIALLTAVTLRGLAPFHFDDAVQSFSWIPFAGLLATQWQDGISILLGKLFQYGACIWLLHRAGLGLARATGIVTVVLAIIEALQTRIPGHVAEVTDPFMALLLGLGLRVL